MEMIETIFLCLPNVFKGTIYRVGNPPDLIVERITSGVVSDDRSKISWGLPAQSEYNPPGKPWLEYRDEPWRPKEAMSWCVEKQKSWTAEEPSNDQRSVSLQMAIGVEDFQHMEPVLVRKADLNLNMYSSFEYPKNYRGESIWLNSDYVVVAVLKLHFRPYTIQINSPETRVIKKLSRSLGTQLLSYQLRQDSMEVMQQLAQDRLNACDILADSLRNAIMKSGLILSLVKQEVGHLRDQWETTLLEDRDEISFKKSSIEHLNRLLMDLESVDEETKKDLRKIQEKFLDLSLSPDQGKRWVEMQIEERWKEIFLHYSLKEDHKAMICKGIENLKRSLLFGQNQEVIANYRKMPEKLVHEWVDIIYSNIENFNPTFLNRLINILDKPGLNIPSRERSRKTLIQLKALAETMKQLERNTNFVLNQVLDGNRDKTIASNLHHFTRNPPPILEGTSQAQG